MRWRRSSLFPLGGKCAGKPGRINCIRLGLVFRRAEEECTQNPNEISALASELVFREVPGKSVQRRWGAERFGGLILVALGDSMGGRVTGVAGAPTGLRLLATGCLAVRLTASALAIADSHVWPEPSPADPARSFPGIGHARSSSPPPGGQLLASIAGSVFGSSAVLVQSWSRSGGYCRRIRQHAGAQEVESGAAVHLSLDHLQPVDLALYLASAPW
jgi:hypothetical protein